MADLDADDLEAKAAYHRANLAETLDALMHSLNVKKLGEEAVGQVSDIGKSAAHSAVHAAKENPAGLALIGIGAALLLSNRKPRERGQLTPADAALAGQADRIENAAERLERKARIKSGRFATGTLSASKLRQMLDAGLDRLGPEARERVIAARLKAVEAQEAVERQARKTKRAVRQAHQSQPFVTGLAVAGIGALIGALLPSTRTENELMGAKRDQLFREAEGILRAELAELETRGKRAVDAAVDSGKAELSGQPRAVG